MIDQSGAKGTRCTHGEHITHTPVGLGHILIINPTTMSCRLSLDEEEYEDTYQ